MVLGQELAHSEMQSASLLSHESQYQECLVSWKRHSAKILVFIYYFKTQTLLHTIINTKSNRVLTKTEFKFHKAASP